MERHLVDHPRARRNERLARYVKHERISRLTGPHQAINVLRRLPRGSGSTSRMQAYLWMSRQS